MSSSSFTQLATILEPCTCNPDLSLFCSTLQGSATYCATFCPGLTDKVQHLIYVSKLNFICLSAARFSNWSRSYKIRYPSTVYNVPPILVQSANLLTMLATVSSKLFMYIMHSCGNDLCKALQWSGAFKQKKTTTSYYKSTLNSID